MRYIVVRVGQDGKPVRAIGSYDNATEAKAAGEVTRCENGESIYVCELHALDVFDVHGVRGFAEINVELHPHMPPGVVEVR